MYKSHIFQSLPTLILWMYFTIPSCTAQPRNEHVFETSLDSVIQELVAGRLIAESYIQKAESSENTFYFMKTSKHSTPNGIEFYFFYESPINDLFMQQYILLRYYFPLSDSLEMGFMEAHGILFSNDESRISVQQLSNGIIPSRKIRTVTPQARLKEELFEYKIMAFVNGKHVLDHVIFFQNNQGIIAYVLPSKDMKYVKFIKPEFEDIEDQIDLFLHSE